MANIIHSDIGLCVILRNKTLGKVIFNFFISFIIKRMPGQKLITLQAMQLGQVTCYLVIQVACYLLVPAVRKAFVGIMNPLFIYFHIADLHACFAFVICIRALHSCFPTFVICIRALHSCFAFVLWKL